MTPRVPSPALDAPDIRAVFICRRCGECCGGSGGIVLRERDAERLAVFLNIPVEEFYGCHAEEIRGKYRLVTTQEGLCVFSGAKGCTVHPAKPDVCRAWPFFRGNLADPVSFAMAGRACPGIRQDADFSLFSRVGARYLLALSLFVLPEEAVRPGALMREAELRHLAAEEALPGMHDTGPVIHDTGLESPPGFNGGPGRAGEAQ